MSRNRYFIFSALFSSIWREKPVKSVYFIESERDYLEGEIRTKRKNKKYKLKPMPLIPKIVRIQTINTCNARCVFCPAGEINNLNPLRKMDFNLFKKIVDECFQIEVGRIIPYFQNEPLCDNELERKLYYITKKRGSDLRPKMHLNTNAGLLTGERSRRLIDSKLDELRVSINSLREEVYESVMPPLKLKKVINNVETLITLREKLKSKTPSVKVIVVRTVENKDEIESMQKFWSDRGIQIDIRRLNNRGKSRIKETGLNPNPWHLREYCRNPFVHLNVLSNGDVNLCCVDYERKHIVGNLGESSLKEIWHGKEFNRLRSKYLRKEWDGLLCATCEITSLK